MNGTKRSVRTTILRGDITVRVSGTYTPDALRAVARQLLAVADQATRSHERIIDEIVATAMVCPINDHERGERNIPHN